MRGTASDIKIQAEEIIKMRERINRIIAKETGTPYEKVAKDTERDYWLSPEEAKAYGIVHKIINNAAELAA
jgi:ATP-dependent Clp protease protease subunit